MKRVSLTVTDEIEREVLRLRRQKKYCDYSKAEIIRMLINQGIEKQNPTTPK